MQVIPREQSADILVTTPQGRPLLVVEVKRRSLDQAARQQIEEYSQALGTEYVMGIDPQRILIAKTQNGHPDWKAAVILPTSEIVRHYADIPDLGGVEGFYLESLIEAWLRDFSFSWKSKEPPGYRELARIGLASRLRNSETHTQR